MAAELGTLPPASLSRRNFRGSSWADQVRFWAWDYDRAVIVLFDNDCAIFRCVALPVDVVRAHGTYRKHLNGRLVQATDALLNHESAEDLTEKTCCHY
jgi:hypothetical protein